MVFVPLFSFGQGPEKNRFEQIPVEGEKVVFADTILSPLDKEEILKSIYYWVNTAETKDRHITDVKNDYDTGILSCKIADYLMVSRSTLTTFPLYMLYSLSFEYKNNWCVVRIQNIRYIEPSDFDQRNRSNIDKFMIPGELPLVEKKYKPAFVKDASEKVIIVTLDNVNALIASIQKHLNK